MYQRTIHILFSILLAGLIYSAHVLDKHHPGAETVTGQVDAIKAISLYGFALAEVSHKSGIDFVHEGPTLDSKLQHIMPTVASMGASVTAVDYDQDGLIDLYVTDSKEGSFNHLYHNLGNGKFDDVAQKLGIADVNKVGTGVSMGAVWGDYDNDGYPDLLVYKWGKPELFHNDQGKGFTDVTDKAGLPQRVNSNSATWLDYDGDGKLDLFICGYYPEDIDLWHLKDTFMMPNSFEFASNGGRKFLLHNNGNGTFTNVTEPMGINSELISGHQGYTWTLAVSAADLTGDGYPDIVLANDYGVTTLYQNQGGRGFRNVGKGAGIGDRPKSGMNVAFGDINNDGQTAIYVSNITDKDGDLLQGNNLWVPDTSVDHSILKYNNLADELGLSFGGWSFGAQFGDLGNRGYQDLALTNGNVTQGPDSYWFQFGQITGANEKYIKDAKEWPAIGNMSLAGNQPKHIWVNRGDGGFTDVAQAVGYTDRHDGRALVLADLWNNGALDMVVANMRGPLLLYKNTVDPKNHWIELLLHGARTDRNNAGANRDAIGARVTLYWKNEKGIETMQTQHVTAASGFCAQDPLRLHFGLGPSPLLEKAVIRWPAPGKEETVTSTLKMDTINTITEAL